MIYQPIRLAETVWKVMLAATLLLFGIILGLTITAPIYFVVQLYGTYNRYQSVEKRYKTN